MLSLILFACSPGSVDVEEMNNQDLVDQLAALETRLVELEDLEQRVEALEDLDGRIAGLEDRVGELEQGQGTTGDPELAEWVEEFDLQLEDMGARVDELEGSAPTVWTLSEYTPYGGATADYTSITSAPLTLELSHLGPVVVICQGWARSVYESLDVSDPDAGFKIVMEDASGTTQEGISACENGACFTSMVTTATFTPWSDTQTISCQSRVIEWQDVQIIAIQLPESADTP